MMSFEKMNPILQFSGINYFLKKVFLYINITLRSPTFIILKFCINFLENIFLFFHCGWGKSVDIKYKYRRYKDE